MIPDVRHVPLGAISDATLADALARVLPDSAADPVPVAAFQSAI